MCLKTHNVPDRGVPPGIAARLAREYLEASAAVKGFSLCYTGMEFWGFCVGSGSSSLGSGSRGCNCMILKRFKTKLYLFFP